MRPTSLTDEDYDAGDLAEVHRQMNALLTDAASLLKRTDRMGRWAPTSRSPLAQLDEAQRTLDQLYSALRSVRTAVSTADANASEAFAVRGDAARELPEHVLAPR